MTDPKPLILNLFEMACISHISHGLWSLPGNNRHRFDDLDYWTELAEILEDGGFDAVFLADVIGAYDVFRDGPETALREGLQSPNLDPLLLVPAMAAVTKRLGFGVTFSTTYEPPFAFARRASTLDHLTKGRFGWNIVTSYLPNAARNFGLDGEIPHDRRYELADEYLDVLYKLWEGSWDDDAVVVRPRAAHRDRPREGALHRPRRRDAPGRRARTSCIRRRSARPCSSRRRARRPAPSSPGGTPSSSSPAGARPRSSAATSDRCRTPRCATAARPTTSSSSPARSSSWVAPRRRRPTSGASTSSTRASTAYLAHASLPVDLTALPRDLTVREALARAGKPLERASMLPLDVTVGTLLDGLRGGRRERFHVVGTPKVVADEIERWLDEDGIDGINLRQFHSFGTAQDFAELVVPELRRRGRLRDDPATSLRDRLFGRGDRLPSTHIGARYRGGANLDVPVAPLEVAPRDADAAA